MVDKMVDNMADKGHECKGHSKGDRHAASAAVILYIVGCASTILSSF